MDFVKKHNQAIIGSIIYIIMVVLILLLLGFSTPLPLPEEEGILLDFGGSGSRTTAGSAPKQVETPKETEAKSDNSSGVVTQNFEESASLESSEVPTTTENKETTSEVVEESSTSTKDDSNNENADKLNNLFSGAFGSGNGGGQSGSGDGNPGMGNGNTGGSGGGPGGIGGPLGNRQILKRVDPEGKDNLVGTVELKITVDEKGYVTNVSLVRTTCNECVQLAINAIKQWRYAPSPGAGYQVGNITINFTQQ